MIIYVVMLIMKEYVRKIFYNDGRFHFLEIKRTNNEIVIFYLISFEMKLVVINIAIAFSD